MRHKSPEASALGVRIHAIVFFIAIAVQIAINLWIGPPYWVQWVVPVWGAGVLAHWWFVLGPGRKRRQVGP